MTFITKIIYKYKDAAIPPQYHRSYTITITKNKTLVKIQSYGDILLDKEFETLEETLLTLNESFIKNKIKQLNTELDNINHIGGPSKSLTIYSSQNIILEGVIYVLKNGFEGNLSGDVEAFTKSIEETVPNFNLLINKE